MPPRDPFKLEGMWRRLDTIRGAMKKSDKNPKTGLTQGGSSRKNSGAKSAAKNADVQKTRKK